MNDVGRLFGRPLAQVPQTFMRSDQINSPASPLPRVGLYGNQFLIDLQKSAGNIEIAAIASPMSGH